MVEWCRRGLNEDFRTGDATGPILWARLQQMGQHHPGTVRRFFRRLRRIVYESSGVFAYDQLKGQPLDLRKFKSGRPGVVDIASLTDRHLQRFVVAALLHQARDLQTGPGASRGMQVRRGPWGMRCQEATGTPAEGLVSSGAQPVRHGPRVVAKSDDVPF